MTDVRRSAFYALCLMLGAVLFGVAGLAHPVLRGDGAVQLATIARTEGWRVIHWSLLFGLPLMLVGLAGVSLRHQDSPGAGPARAAVILATFGFAAWMINILFMAGAGWHLARTYAVSEPGLTATHAVLLYDMLHPFGLAAERLATFTMGLALYLFGWAIRNGRVHPTWLSWGAFAAGATCIVIPLVVQEDSVVLFYGQATLIAWMAAAGVVMFIRR
ncbi:MAG: hypothetical protein ACREMW_03825 [Gemmatimonadales bacterium]